MKLHEIIILIYIVQRYIIYMHDAMHAAFIIYRIRTRTQVRAGIIGILFLGWTSIFIDLAKEFKNAIYCLTSLWKHGRSLEKDDDSDDIGGLVA